MKTTKKDLGVGGSGQQDKIGETLNRYIIHHSSSAAAAYAHTLSITQIGYTRSILSIQVDSCVRAHLF